jgi:hypothetical protein
VLKSAYQREYADLGASLQEAFEESQRARRANRQRNLGQNPFVFHIDTAVQVGNPEREPGDRILLPSHRVTGGWAVWLLACLPC